MQDKSRQEEFKAAQAERQLEIERLKRGALEENLRHQKGTFFVKISHLFKINKKYFLNFFLTLNLEMKKVDHQNAMKRAEYEDQLRQQAKDRNMQRELDMQSKQEQLKRRKFLSCLDKIIPP